MATSSADPEDLGTYVTDATAARMTLSTAAAGVRSYYDDVVARFGAQYSLSHPDLWVKLSAHLTDAEQRDRFVGTVKDAFVAADRGSAGTAAGTVTVEDSRIAAGLAAAGIGTLPTTTLTVDDPVLHGHPPDSGFAADPVCTANGNLVEQELDLPLPGRAAPAGWRRTYNSRAHDRIGAHGRGWSSWADTALDVGDEQVEWRAPDGARSVLVRPGVGRPTELPLLGATLHADGAGFRFTRGPGETWWYDEAGQPVRVRVDRAELLLAWSDGRLKRLSHPRSGRSLELVWDDERALVAAVRASDGRQVRYAYDTHANLVAVEGGPQGARRYRHADEAGAGTGPLAEIVDADGVTLARTTFDEAGRVLTQLSPEGRLVQFAYREGRRTLVTDAAGGAINEYRHDSAGRLVCAVDDADRPFYRVFDEAGRLRGIEERSGARWTMDYDDAGNLVHRAGPCGITERWSWDSLGRLTGYVDPRGHLTRWVYAAAARTPVEIVDAAGALTRITVNDDDLPTCVVDPDGVTTRFRWDDDAQLIDIRVAGGGRTRLRYDPAGRLAAITGPTGQTREWDSDDAGRVVCEQGPDGAGSSYHYTPAGRPDGYVDPAGGRWGSSYGPHGRVEQVVDPLGATLGFEYDLFGNTTLIVAPDGEKFHFDHDGLGRLVALSDPAGATFRRGYDPDGRPNVESDAEGHEWRVEYDEAGRAFRRTSPDGRVWQRAYDPAGAVIAETDPAGAVSRYEHDPRGRVVAVTDQLGGRRTLEWTLGGRLAAVTTPLGRRESYGYDRAGRWVQTTAPSGARTLYRRDAAGRLTALVTPAGRETTWEYDAYGRVVAVTRPGGRRTTIEHNPLGLPVAITDGTGAVRRYTYDARGALTSATDPLGAVTRYTYDARGQLAGWSDPLGGRHELRHDEVGRPTATTDPLGRTTTVVRDHNGRVHVVRHADGTGTRSWWDSAGRLIGRGLPDERAPRFQYLYDAAGRLERVRTASVEGSADPLSGTGREGTADPDVQVALDYDLTGRLTARTTAAGRLAWSYDGDGRCVSVGRAGGTPVRYEYDDDGRLRSVAHPALGRRVIARDPDGRPARGPGRTVERDGAGRIIRVVDGGEDLRFGYDRAGQLVSARGPWGRWAFTWDPGGRMVAEDRGDPESVIRCTYDAAGRLVERRIGDGLPTTFGYDAAGRRRTEDGPTGVVCYDWDALGRLREVRREPTGTMATGPHAAGRSDRLVVDALGDPLEVNGQAVLWDPVAWPGQAHAVGGRTYARAGSAIGVIEDAVTSGSGALPPATGRWLELDWQGSPGHHDVWGLPIATGAGTRTGSGSAAAGSRLGTGDLPVGAPGLDSALGYRGELVLGDLVWQRARVLDPRTRSFLSPDPLANIPGMPGQANPYHHAWNDPVGMVDPTGLRPLTDAEYDGYRNQAGKGMFEKAWDNVRKDPWGSLGAAAVIGVGVGLMFVPGGQAVGAGILIGAGSSAAIGLVTGNFDPRTVALAGIAGGVGGGVAGGLARTGLSAAASNAIGGAAQDLATQSIVHPGQLNLGELAFSTATGGLAGRFGGARSVAGGDGLAAAEIGVASKLTGAPIRIYRGSSRVLEEYGFEETGLVMSDAALHAYGATGDLSAALRISQEAHQAGIAAWGSEPAYAEAHVMFGTDIDEIGEKSMISFTADPGVAKRFANGGVVYSTTINPGDGIVIPNSSDSEILIRHMIGVERWSQ
ncbi:DUF6531 domain-containing protein [Frankia sp. AgPm24]|uniref:DUF6531 domain-containing protein n=1 Tax=Frankia sp. AgPm24 TaxID=631128 RepID=UPI00200FFA6F|nr:DUF6531 domain-containing protein [Frankia sp. AgPm24]MCK9923673.1 DUF6531 domain-containing protein [Frankia sp. AgPm24]